MGRKQTIDRDEVLRVAETIVAQSGASKLTIEAVARAAGISVGGVQYCFRSKEILIEAMLNRWAASYASEVEERVGLEPEPLVAVRAHIEVTGDSDSASHTKSASLLAALLGSPDHLKSTQSWYEQRLEGLDLGSDEGRRARVAFFATEGAFFLRYFGFMRIPDPEWSEIFSDILAEVGQIKKLHE